MDSFQLGEHKEPWDEGEDEEPRQKRPRLEAVRKRGKNRCWSKQLEPDGEATHGCRAPTFPPAHPPLPQPQRQGEGQVGGGDEQAGAEDGPRAGRRPCNHGGEARRGWQRQGRPQEGLHEQLLWARRHAQDSTTTRQPLCEGPAGGLDSVSPLQAQKAPRPPLRPCLLQAGRHHNAPIPELQYM